MVPRKVAGQEHMDAGVPEVVAGVDHALVSREVDAGNLVVENLPAVRATAAEGNELGQAIGLRLAEHIAEGGPLEDVVVAGLEQRDGVEGDRLSAGGHAVRERLVNHPLQVTAGALKRPAPELCDHVRRGGEEVLRRLDLPGN